MKTLEDQGAITNRPTKQRSSFFLLKSLYEATDNNSNTVKTSAPLQYPFKEHTFVPNSDPNISLLGEGIDSF